MSKKAVIIVGPRFQDHEFIYPFFRIQEAGFDLDVATTGKTEVLGDFGTKVTPTMDTKDLPGKADKYDLVFLPGGAKSLEKIRQDKDALTFIKEAFEKNKVIGAICHGTQLLISAGVLKGKKATGYYSIADDINNAGAVYLNEPVVEDGNLITSPHYKDMPVMFRALIAKFENR